MSRTVEALRRGVTTARERLLAVSGQSERTLLLAAILLLSAVSAFTSAVLAGYYSIDVFSSLFFPPQDCWLDWGTRIGRHCFCDYANVVDMGLRPNPWEPYAMRLPWNNYQAAKGSNYPAVGMLPPLLFGLVATWFNSPRLGLLIYLPVLASAVFTPAVWASRGARGLQRVVVLVALGAAAIPAWTVIDVGNSVGFLVPIALAFLVALCRQRWGLVAITVILAAMVKPQFAVLAVALFAARQWRRGGITIAGVVITNLAAYLIWPRDFPGTISQSIHNTLGYGSSPGALLGPYNVSFQRGIFLVPDLLGLTSDGSPVGVRSLIGYVVLFLIVICVLALGQRISPIMVGIVLLAAAALFPSLEYKTYLVFALPIAALVVRDPDGPAESGIFDRLAAIGDPRRAVGVCVSVAAALSIAHIPVPGTTGDMPIAGQRGAIGIIGTTPIVLTTAWLVPIAWLVACAAILVSYARRPMPRAWTDAFATSVSNEPAPAAAASVDTV